MSLDDAIAIGVEPDTSGFSRALAKALKPAIDKVVKGLTDLDKRMDRVEQSATNVAKAVAKIDTGKLVKGVDQLDDSLDAVQSRLKRLTLGDLGAPAALKVLDRIEDGVARVAASAGDIDFSGGEGDVSDLTRGVDGLLRGLEGVGAAAADISFRSAIAEVDELSDLISTIEVKLSSIGSAASDISFSAPLFEAQDLADSLDTVLSRTESVAASTRDISFAGAQGEASDLARTLERVQTSASGGFGQAQIDTSGANRAGADLGAAAEEGFSQSFGRGALASAGAVVGPVLRTFAKAAGVAGGIGAAFFGGTALVKGNERLTTIEDSVAALNIQLGDTAKTAQLVDSVLATVRGTPFNLDQFVGAARTMVTFGTSIEDIPRLLTNIGEAASASGLGQEAVQPLVDIFSQVQAFGKIGNDEINRLIGLGVPAGKILGNAFGVTELALRDMVREGVVPADKALEALQRGIEEGSTGVAGTTAAFAGSMEALRQTFSGAAGGFSAATARFGAAFLEPFRDDAVVVLTKAASALDAIGGKVKQFATAISDTGILMRFADALDGIPSAVERAGEVFEDLGDLWTGLVSTVQDGDFIGFGPLLDVEEDSSIVDILLRVGDAWRATVAGLKEGFAAVKAIFTGEEIEASDTSIGRLVEQLATIGQSLFQTLGPPIAALLPVVVELFSAFSPFGLLLDVVTPIVDSLSAALVTLVEALGPILSVVGEVAGTIAAGLTDAVVALLPALVEVGVVLQGAFLEVLIALLPVMPALAEAVISVVEAVVPLLGLIPPIVEWFAKLIPVVAGIITKLVEFKPLTVLVLTLAGAFIYLLPIVTSVIGFFSTVGGVLASVGGAITSISALFTTLGGGLAGVAGVIGALFSPVTLIVGAVAALGVGLGLLYTKVEPVRDAIDSLIDVLVAVGGTIAEVAGNYIGFLVDNLKILWDVLSQVAGIIGALFSGDFAEVGERLRKLGSTIVDVVTELPGRILAIFGDLPQMLWGALQAAFDFVVQQAPGALSALGGLLSDLPGLLVSGLGSLGSIVVDALSSVGGFLVDALSGLGTLALDALGAAWDFVTGELPGVLAGALGVVLGFGGDLVKSLGDGIVAAVQQAPDLLSGFIDSAIEQVQKIPGLLLDGLKAAGPIAAGIADFLFSTLPGAIGDVLSGIGSFLVDRLKEAWDFVYEKKGTILKAVALLPLAIPALFVAALVKLGPVLFDIIKGAFGWVVTNGPKIISGLVRFFLVIPSKLLNGLKNLGGILFNGFKEAFLFVVERGPDAIRSIITFFEDLPKRIIAVLAGGGQWLWDSVFMPAFDFVTEELPKMLLGIVDWFKDLPSKVGGAILNADKWLLEKVFLPAFRFVTRELPKLLRGVANWFKDLPGKVARFITGADRWLLDKVFAPAFRFVTKSLPKLLLQVGSFFQDLPGKILSGIASGATWLWDEVLYPAIMFAVEEGPRALSAIVGLFTDIPMFILDAIGAGATWLWDEAIFPALDYVVTELPGVLLDVLGFFGQLPFEILGLLVDLGSFLWDRALKPAGRYLGEKLPEWGGNLLDFFTGLPGMLWDALGDLGRFLWDNLVDGLDFLEERFREFWDRLPERAGAAVDSVVDFFTALPGRISDLAGDIFDVFSDIGADILDGILDGLAAVGSFAGDLARDIGGAIAGWLNDNVIDGINDGIRGAVDALPFLDAKDVFGRSGPIPRLPEFARGDVVNSPTVGIFGEAGPEVIVPLSNPERMVELLTQALQMTAGGRAAGKTAGLPQFAEGAIFSPGRTRRISASADVIMPEALRLALREIGVASQDLLGAGINYVDGDITFGAKPGTIAGRDTETHLKLIDVLMRRGFTGQIADDLSGTLTKGGVTIKLDADSGEGLFPGIHPELSMLERMNDAFRQFGIKALSDPSSVAKGGDLAANGVVIDFDADGARLIDRLQAAGLAVDYRGGQWFAGDIPISPAGQKFEDSSFRLWSDNNDLMAQIARALQDGNDVGPDDFVAAFNKLNSTLQDAVLASQVSLAKNNPDVASLLTSMSKFAYGDVVNRPTLGIFGEAGPEVILPLSKPHRVVELATQALSMIPGGASMGAAAGLPAFANGAIFKPRSSPREIDSINDLDLPGPLRGLIDQLIAMRSQLEAAGANIDTSFALGDNPGSVGGLYEGPHLQLINALWKQGFVGKIDPVELSGTLDDGRRKIIIDDRRSQLSTPFVPVPADFRDSRLIDRINDVYRFFKVNAIDKGNVVAEQIRDEGFVVDFTTNGSDLLDRLKQAGMDVKWDQGKGQWFADGTPVSPQGIEYWNSTFRLWTEERDLRKEIARILAGTQDTIEGTREFKQAFNKLAAQLQEAVMVAQISPPTPDISYDPMRLNTRISKFAYGDVVNTPTLGVFGEAGPEVILPLSRPDRMVELLSTALRMTGKPLPEFFDGAIFTADAAPTKSTSGRTPRSPKDEATKWLEDLAKALDKVGLSSNRIINTGRGFRGADWNAHQALLMAIQSMGLKIQASAPNGAAILTDPPRSFVMAAMPGKDPYGHIIPFGEGGGKHPLEIVASGLKSLADAFDKVGVKPGSFETTPQGVRGKDWKTHALINEAFHNLGFKIVQKAFDGSALFRKVDETTKRVQEARLAAMPDTAFRLRNRFKPGKNYFQPPKDLSGWSRPVPIDLYTGTANAPQSVKEVAARAYVIGTKNNVDVSLAEFTERLAGLTEYGRGDVVTRPTLGIFGEAGPEVIVPLSDTARMIELLDTALGRAPRYGNGAVFSNRQPVGAAQSTRAPIEVKIEPTIVTENPDAMIETLSRAAKDEAFLRAVTLNANL